MSKKKTLLVGSLPFENEQEAMEYAAHKLGSSLLALPSGEIGMFYSDLSLRASLLLSY
jgi:hypothetical protein